MRPDMAKVIVERPRIGSRSRCAQKGYQKRLQRTAIDELAKREGIHAQKGHTKSLNEHLRPLERYLNKQVGRPWDKVFSEICENIRLDSAVQSHVRDHLADFVETKVILIDGVLCSGSPYWVGRPLAQCRQRMYVCPRTGLLRRVKPRKFVRTPKPVQRVPVDSNREYRLIEGIWYEVELRVLSDAARNERDFVLGGLVKDLNARDVMKTYGANVYAARRRQLNKRQLRTAGLVNAQPG